jgi:hypothetical protein
MSWTSCVRGTDTFLSYVICTYWKQKNGPSARSDSSFTSYVEEARSAPIYILVICHTYQMEAE